MTYHNLSRQVQNGRQELRHPIGHGTTGHPAGKRVATPLHNDAILKDKRLNKSYSIPNGRVETTVTV
jgi:hypothetical protein